MIRGLLDQLTTQRQIPPPSWLTGMSSQPQGLMNIFNPAPQSTFPMGGLMDFNAMASDLAGPAPELSGLLGSPINMPPINTPQSSFNPFDISSMPFMRQEVPGMSRSQPGYDAELEAISRRAAIEAARQSAPQNTPNTPNIPVNRPQAQSFYQPTGSELEALARRAAIERMR